MGSQGTDEMIKHKAGICKICSGEWQSIEEKDTKKREEELWKRTATEIRNFVGEDFFGNFNNDSTCGTVGKSSLYMSYW